MILSLSEQLNNPLLLLKTNLLRKINIEFNYQVTLLVTALNWHPPTRNHSSRLGTYYLVEVQVYYLTV